MENHVVEVEKGRVLCSFKGFELRHALGDQDVLPDGWTGTAKMIMESKRKGLVVSSGIRKTFKKTATK